MSDIEKLRRDLAATFEARGDAYFVVDSICWHVPDEWTQAAAWILEGDKHASALSIGRQLAAISRYMSAYYGFLDHSEFLAIEKIVA